MKIKVIKPHAKYEIGEHEVDEQRGKYLIAMNVAEAAEMEETKDDVPSFIEGVSDVDGGMEIIGGPNAEIVVADPASEGEPEEKHLVSNEDQHTEKSEVKKRGRKPKNKK